MPMSTTDLAPTIDPAIVERVLLEGDLGKLTANQRVAYYGKVCEALGLNPLTRPFEYLVLNNRLVLYARRECTEQLRKVYKVSLSIVARELTEELYAVTAKAQLPDGRTDESIGVKSLAGLKGDARANAMMTAETKSKRRVTLSICGLGMLDETEVESLPAEVPQTLSQTGMARVTTEPVASLDAGQVVADSVQNTRPVAPDALQIVRVEKVATKRKDVFQYYVTFSNGQKTVTIAEWMAALCEQAAKDNIPVRIETKETQWSRRKDGTVVPDLVKITRADEPEQPHLEPLTVDDIPFSWLFPILLALSTGWLV